MPRRSRGRCVALSTATVTIACAALLVTVAAMRAPDVSKREITWATQTVNADAGGDSSGSITSTDAGADVGSSGWGAVISANPARVRIWRQEQSSDFEMKMDAQLKRAKRAPKTATTVTRSLGVQARVHIARVAAAMATTSKVIKTTTTTAKTTPRRPTTSRLLTSTTSRSSGGGSNSSNSSNSSSSSSSSTSNSSSNTGSTNSNFNSATTATVAAATAVVVVADTTNTPTLNTSKALATTEQVNPSAVAISSAFSIASAKNVVTPTSSRTLAVTAERSENGTTLSNLAVAATTSQSYLYSTRASSALPTVVDFDSRVSKVATPPTAHVTSVSREVLTTAATAQLPDPAAAVSPADVSKAENATSAAASAVGARTSVSLQTSSADSSEEFSEKISSIAPLTVTQASGAAVTSRPAAALSSFYALRTTDYGVPAAVTAVTTASPSLDMSPPFSASTSDRKLSVSSSAVTSRAITVLSVGTAQPSIYKASSLAVSDETSLTRWLGTSSPPGQATGGAVTNATISSRAVEWHGNSTASTASGMPVARSGTVSDVRPAWRLAIWLCGMYSWFSR